MARINAQVNTKIGYISVQAEDVAELKATIDALKETFGLKVPTRVVEETEY